MSMWEISRGVLGKENEWCGKEYEWWYKVKGRSLVQSEFLGITWSESVENRKLLSCVSEGVKITSHLQDELVWTSICTFWDSMKFVSCWTDVGQIDPICPCGQKFESHGSQFLVLKSFNLFSPNS